MMDRISKKDLDYLKAVSVKTHPSPDADSRFYRKFKSQITLSNPQITYNKHRKGLSDC